jgi:hypothetical protein
LLELSLEKRTRRERKKSTNYVNNSCLTASVAIVSSSLLEKERI